MPETITITIPDTLAGERLDKAAAILCADLSRARLQAMIAAGDLTLNGCAASASVRVKAQDILAITVPPLQDAVPQAQDIALDIVYEDEDLLVLNKPVGLVVHPGAGHADQTLVNALLYHCGDSLSGIGGVKRPGIVHRLDKDTSGLMLVAKNDKTHQDLSTQLQERTVSRTYWAVTVGQPIPVRGTVDQPIGRHPTNRQKQAITRQGRHARTHYAVQRTYGPKLALVTCKLDTGRTHQIRVHMAYLKCPLLGDTLYGAQQTAVRAALRDTKLDDIVRKGRVLAFGRQALHAYELAFIHPRTGEDMFFETNELPADFGQLLNDLSVLFPA